MEKVKVLEVFGQLEKEEILQTVGHNIIPNTLVLENQEPFPGYHGVNLPQDKNPDTLFLVTVKKYPTDNILRTGNQIKKALDINFDTGPARIRVYNDYYDSIRIRELDSYDNIAEIQRFFLDEGIKFNKKKNIHANGLISLKKTFLIESVTDNIYKDIEDPSMFYLDIPYYLTWNIFKTITKNLKNNLDFRNFDAALGYFYVSDLMDFIRIYSTDIEMSQLSSIRDKYLEMINRYMTD
ncbi:MAG: hypothetical protein JXJ22_05515 [Bacteroidales bacterium]|nr:hypothetical protein [Bacteroidales bacterium]